MGVWLVRVRVLVAAMVVLGSLIPTAAAAASAPRDIGQFACPPADVPPSGYRDTDGNLHADAIDCLAWYGITQGTSPSAQRYDPSNNVSRGQMAAFLVRLANSVDPRLLPPYQGNRFTDVHDGHVFVAEINRLAAAGVVAGGPGGRPATEFGPALAVSRAQMASFLTRLDRLVTGASLPQADDCFADDNGNVHEASINALCSAGVVAGRAPGVYAPSDLVRRDAMASFLMRLTDLLVEGHHTAPPGKQRTALTLKNPSLVAGDNLTGTLQGGGISGVTVQGCGLANGTEVRRGDGGAFTLRIPESLASGSCVITFRVTFADGTVESIDRTLTVQARKVDLASLAVSPTSDSTATHSTASGTDVNRGRREFTVTGVAPDGKPAAGAIVDLRLVDAAGVRVGANGAPVFVAGTGANAALAPASTAVIEGVAGAAQAANVRTVSGVRLGANGAVIVTVDATAPDAVRLVAFGDPSDDNALRINANGTPADTEKAAVGGQTTLLPPLATSFNVNETGLVTHVDKSAGRVGVLKGGTNGAAVAVSKTDRLYSFDGNDEYRIAGAGVNRAAFLAELSRADVVKVGPYGSGSGDISVFDIVTNNPQPPSVTAKAEATPGTVTVTITGSNPQQLSLYSKFVVQRAPVTGGTAGQGNGTVGTWSTVGEPVTDADVFTAGFQLVQTGVPAGMYRYRTAGVVDGQQSGFSSGTANLAVGSAGPPPVSLTLAVTQDNGPAGSGGANGVLDQGDRLTATFDQAVGLASGWDLRLLDRDGTVARIEGSRATTSVGGPGDKQVTFTLTSAPQIQANGTNANVNLTTGDDNYLEVLSAAGINGAGGAWNLPASGVPGSSPTRTFAGGNGRLPAVPTDVTTNPGTGTVTVGASSNVQNGEVVYVFDHRGVQIGQATKGSGATTITTSPAFTAGQVLYVVYRDSAGGPNNEAFSQSLKLTAQTVSVSGISPANGTKSGGTTVTITGSGFNTTTVRTSGGCTVFIGDVCVTSVANITSTSFTAVTPSSGVVGTALPVMVAGVTNPSVRYTYTNAAPTVVVTGGPANASTVAPGTVTYSGTASDPDGSSTLDKVQVQLKKGASVVSAWATTAGPNPWSWTSDALDAGSYTVEIRAVDDLGATSAIVSRTLTVS